MNKETIKITTILKRLESKRLLTVDMSTRSILKNCGGHHYRRLASFGSRANLYYIIAADYSHLVLRENETLAYRFKPNESSNALFWKDIGNRVFNQGRI